MVWFSAVSSIEVTVKSLYPSRKLNSPVVMTPGHITGITARRNAWNRVQPSTSALSSRSRGIDRKKLCSIHSVNGWFIATMTMIVVGRMPQTFSSKNGSRYPDTSVICGIARKISAAISSQNV